MDNSNKIKIGDKFYKPKDEFNQISEEVLKLCNFTHLKHHNNKTSLKVGEGKASFSNGLSINQFREKYHVK
jgi:hypothetical protein